MLRIRPPSSQACICQAVGIQIVYKKSVASCRRRLNRDAACCLHNAANRAAGMGRAQKPTAHRNTPSFRQPGGEHGLFFNLIEGWCGCVKRVCEAAAAQPGPQRHIMAPRKGLVPAEREEAQHAEGRIDGDKTDQCDFKNAHGLSPYRWRGQASPPIKEDLGLN